MKNEQKLQDKLGGYDPGRCPVCGGFLNDSSKCNYCKYPNNPVDNEGDAL